jgi:short chain dehydrogenase
MYNINKVIEKKYNPAKKSVPKGNQFLNLKVGLLIIKELLFYTIKSILSMKYMFRKPKSIENQLALVTGGGNGLGREICFRLAKEKCHIAVVDIDIENATQTANEIAEKFNVRCKAFLCDVSNYDEVLKLKLDIEADLGPVDILVNNAGLLFMSYFLTSKIKDVQKVINVNLMSHFYVSFIFYFRFQT